MFHAGQKVVCVRNQETAVHALVTMGAVYTVRNVGDCGHPLGPWVRLEEVRNKIVPVCRWDGAFFRAEPVYSAYWFRPIVARKTDIGVFKALLNPVREKEPA